MFHSLRSIKHTEESLDSVHRLGRQRPLEVEQIAFRFAVELLETGCEGGHLDGHVTGVDPSPHHLTYIYIYIYISNNERQIITEFKKLYKLNV